MTVKGIYTPPRPIPQVDGEPLQMRISGAQPPASTVTADGDQIVLVVRMNFAGKDLADDTDNLLRYSAGAIRLVAGEPDNNAPFKNYYPVATLDGRGTGGGVQAGRFSLSDMAERHGRSILFLSSIAIT